MLQIFNRLREVDLAGICIRMLLACVCGAAVGLERSSKNRPAGFRTHTLVCIAATVAATTGIYLFTVLKLPSDISRISGQVVSGLGFIGAGTIIVTKQMSIKGLTTAAGLWTTGIIGLAIGSGFYEIALIGTVMVLLVESTFDHLGKRIRHTPSFALELLYNEKDALDAVLRYCKDKHLTIENLRIQSHESGMDGRYSAVVDLRGSASENELLQKIRCMPGIHSAILR